MKKSCQVNGEIKLNPNTWKRDLNKVNDFLSKLVVYRMLSGLSDSQSRRKYAALSFNLNKKNIGECGSFINLFNEVVINELKNKDNEGKEFRFPKISELNLSLRDELPLNEIYKKNRKVLEWTFRVIEMKKSTNKINYNDKYSIDHIYPQDSSNWDFSNGNKEKMNSLLHTLGNLSLIDTSSNSSIGNKNFYEKKKAMDKKSKSKMDEYIYKNSEWTEDEIIKRSKEILKDIKDIWK